MSNGYHFLISLLFSILCIFTVTNAKRCEPITIPLCRGIGYNLTSYPNSYGHEKQDEAGLEVHQFYPLVEVGCYKHLRFFLCSLFTPICQENYDQTILPCREVCHQAKQNCAPLMRQYGFNWPASLSCNNLPKMADQATSGQVCAAPPDTPDSEDKTVEDMKKYDKMSKKKTTQTLVYPVIGINELEQKRFDKCQCSCQSPFIFTDDKSQKILNISSCSYGCYAELPKQETKDFVNTWITVWASICFILSLFTILTFFIEMERFQYPERPIFFFAFCQLMVSIGFLIRIYFGHEEIACTGDLIRIGNHTLSPCLLVFILTYFFGMAASAWWVILCLSWLLAAAPKWANESIASYAPLYHLFSWFIPAVQTLLVMLLNAIDGDPISGLCFVGNTNSHFQRVFVLGPLIVYFVVGIFFLSIGFLNLWHIRSVVKKTSAGLQNTNKITQLMSKIGIFSVLYTVPALFYILVLFYEQYYRPIWQKSKLCNCAPQVEFGNENAILVFSLIKTAAMLMIGWTSGVWILSIKTISSWKNFFFGKRNCSVPYLHHHNTLYNTVSRPNTRFVGGPSPQYHQTEVIYAKTNEAMSPQLYGTMKGYNSLYPIIPDKV